jgi:hypothetical protein
MPETRGKRSQLANKTASKEKLLKSAERALADDNEEDAIPFLKQILEITIAEKAPPEEQADAYYDLGNAYNSFSKALKKGKQLRAVLNAALFNLNQALLLYPLNEEFRHDREVCSTLIAQTNNRSKVFQPSSPKKKATTSSGRTRYRELLIQGALIKQVTMKKNAATFEINPPWNTKKGHRAIHKMLHEIKRSRAAFRQHLKINLLKDKPLTLTLVDPSYFEDAQAVISFIQMQAKREPITRIVQLLRNKTLIKQATINNNVAEFTINPPYDTPEELIKVNTCLYNLYVTYRDFSVYFCSPIKTNTTP